MSAREGLRRKRPLGSILGLVAAAIAASACDSEPDVWDTVPSSPVQAIGLAGSVALVDAPAERVMMLAVEQDLTLATRSVPIGEGFVAASKTPDDQKLLVLTRGVVPRLEATDEGPTLRVIDGGTDPRLTAIYRLSDPLSGLAVDPQSTLAVVHPSESDVAFVQNPNELNIVDLTKKASATNPTPITLRSFGGRPQGFTFTDPLALPGGTRRLLVVQTDRDVALLDLADLGIPEITIRLTSDATPRHPAGIAVTDGAPDRDDDARIAIRTDAEPEVIVVDLAPVPSEDDAATPQTFRALPNVVYVGGVPSDLAFVATDGGLRLAALVPSQQSLALVDPSTGSIDHIDLGAPFERISVVTDEVGAAGGTADVALLWSSSSPQVALAALGGAVGTPYRSIERLDLTTPVSAVTAVAAPNQRLRVLTGTGGNQLVVLDLLARTASPLVASTGATVAASPDGQRLWLTSPNTPAIAQVELDTLHPKNFALRHGAFSALDVTRRGGGRALVAIHAVGAGSLTVLDALNPSLTTSREYAGVLLGELP
jgi:hypothetical protein